MNYMSPEALSPPECDNEFKLSRKSDIWSLGCILYQMVRSAMFEFGLELGKISWRGRVHNRFTAKLHSTTYGT